MIIGIGGVSNAGKSSLANLLKIELEKEHKIKILCQDDFINSVEKIPLVNNLIDWEHPSSINHEMFLQAVTRESRNNDIVISEGLFAFYSDRLCKMYNNKIFLKIDKNTFYERKKRDLRWGKVPNWYIHHIWDSYQRYGKASQMQHTIKIDATLPFDIKKIIQCLNI